MKNNVDTLYHSFTSLEILPKRNTRRTTGPRGLPGVEGERQAGVLDMFFLPKIKLISPKQFHICKCIPNRLVLEENQLLREAEAGARQRLERVQVGLHDQAEKSFKMRKIYKGNHKVEAQKRLEIAEEELASNRIENSRLSLANQRLQEEVCQILRFPLLGFYYILD